MSKKGFRYCIFLHSGSYDRVYQAMSISTVVLAMGGEVHIFCSYGGLLRMVKGRTDEVIVEGEPEPFKAEIEKNLNRGTLDHISDLLATAHRFGEFHIYACSASMAVLNVTRDELIELVDASMGLVSFLELVKDADKVLYI
jgi:peroxiredoxin family protein